MKLVGSVIELNNGRVIQPCYMDASGNWQDHDLKGIGLTDAEQTEAKALFTNSVKTTFKQVFGAGKE